MTKANNEEKGSWMSNVVNSARLIKNDFNEINILFQIVQTLQIANSTDFTVGGLNHDPSLQYCAAVSVYV